MDYLMLVRVPDDAAPTPEEASPDAWVDETMADRTRVFGEQLQPADEATTVRVRDGEVLLTDGPFAELREMVAGFDVLRVASRDEAVAVAGAHPVAGYGALELRAIRPADDAPVAPAAADRARYLMLLVDEDASPAAAGSPAGAASPEAVGAWLADLRVRGLDAGGGTLGPASVTVRRVGGELVVTEEPEPGPRVVGYRLVAAEDLDEALAVATAHPATSGAIEVRALWSGD